MAKEKKEGKKTRRPTAQKRDIQNEKKRLTNKKFKSEMRTTIRRFHESLKQSDSDLIKEKLNHVYSALDKAVKRGTMKINAASRTKSRLAARAAAKQ